jgi:hypothetical protein
MGETTFFSLRETFRCLAMLKGKKKGLFLEDLWAFDVMEAERALGVEEKI